jgi:plasmid stabilization system protein ParE
MITIAKGEADLEEIAGYIARDNPHRALSTLLRSANIAATSLRSQSRPLVRGIRRGHLVTSFGRYPIFYTEEPDKVRIERILSGSRLLSSDYFAS